MSCCVVMRDSALGRHSADFGDLEATADHQFSSAPKSPKNHESSTAIPRILEEYNQGRCKKPAASKKVDSSENAENVEKSHSKQTEGDKRRRRQDLPMILWVFKAWAKGFTLSGNEQAHAAESRKSAAKPTPTKTKSGF